MENHSFLEVMKRIKEGEEYFQVNETLIKMEITMKDGIISINMYRDEELFFTNVSGLQFNESDIFIQTK